jgi:hypothetical protein
MMGHTVHVHCFASKFAARHMLWPTASCGTTQCVLIGGTDDYDDARMCHKYYVQMCHCYDVRMCVPLLQQMDDDGGANRPP